MNQSQFCHPSKSQFQSRRKYQRGDGDLVIIFFLCLILMVTAIVVACLENKHFNIKDTKWSAVSSVTTDATMGNFHFIGEDEYEANKWSYTDLSNGDVLVNPFETHLLCHIKTRPDNGSLINEVITKEIIQAKQNHTSLIVKPIAVNWQDNDDMLQRGKSCPDLDMSGQYILYRGHRVVELLGLVSSTGHNPSSIADMQTK